MNATNTYMPNNPSRRSKASQETPHPVTYREEILSPIFSLSTAGESVAVIASASMGKSRLTHFLLRKDVARHYLAAENEELLFIRVDFNRMLDFTAWHLYELVLDACLSALEENDTFDELRSEYLDLHLEVVRSGNSMLAQRLVERLLRNLCRKHQRTLCLILDEFDDAYVQLPSQVLAGLRGLRDANKYRLCYLLFTRQHPQQLRDPAECEGLFEQFSRNILYLQPYQNEDARRVIHQLGDRRNVPATILTSQVVEELITLSGGHAGLMTALVSGLKDEPPFDPMQLTQWASDLGKVREECRKIYDGLQREEQTALRLQSHDALPSHSSAEQLVEKGLLTKNSSGDLTIFSLLLQAFVASQIEAPLAGLSLDEDTGLVTVNGTSYSELTGLPFDLLRILARRDGDIVSRDEIAASLYGNSDGVTNNQIDAVVTRLRHEIEPDPSKPQFIKTVRGRGYRLIFRPDEHQD